VQDVKILLVTGGAGCIGSDFVRHSMQHTDVPVTVLGKATLESREYFAGKAAAPRPLQSRLDFAELRATGFAPAAAAHRLRNYVAALTTA
jgi:dTDP-D-glucose 4,6-dehydratase